MTRDPWADVCLMGRVLLAVALFLLAGWLDGCAHVASAGALWTEPFPRVEVPDLPTQEGAPVVVVVGQPSPLTGFAMGADLALWYSDASEQRDGLALALDLAYSGRQADRDEAEAVLVLLAAVLLAR